MRSSITMHSILSHADIPSGVTTFGCILPETLNYIIILIILSIPSDTFVQY